MDHHKNNYKFAYENHDTHDQSGNNKSFTFASDLLLQILESDEITCEEQDVLREFYNVAAARLKRIFDSKRYRDRFIYTIRGSNIKLPIEDGISTFETLFNDCLGEIMVLISMTQF
jgi:hypothetical protein